MHRMVGDRLCVRLENTTLSDEERKALSEHVGVTAFCSVRPTETVVFDDEPGRVYMTMEKPSWWTGEVAQRR